MLTRRTFHILMLLAFALASSASGQQSGMEDREAARLYMLAADQGSAIGQAGLGVFYEDGRGGLPQDDAQAVVWYHKAADGGNAYAMAYLGYMYEKGRGGLPKDMAQALSWYHKAAALGDETAQEALKRIGAKE